MNTVEERLIKKYVEEAIKNKAGSKAIPIYQLLYKVIKDLILNNDIPENSNLPPSRLIKSKLNISRSTVIKSYELLRMEGYLNSLTGSGYQIKNPKKSKTPIDNPNYNPNLYPEISETGKSFFQNKNLINSTDDKSIAFRPGLPPLDIFPVNRWKNLINLYWKYIKFSDLSYSPSSGLDILKKNIATYLNLNRDIKCDYRQIVIVSGSLQSLFLIGSVVLNRGDKVILENPTFPNVHSIFKGLGADISAENIDAEGLKISKTAKNLQNLKLIHITPSCQYPTGTVMTEKRKKEILEFANQQKCLIVENDYEHQINNYYKSQPSIFSLDNNQRTVYLGTFNRILHPSIRIGYMVLPHYLIDPVDALLRHSHRFVPPSIQIVLNEFIEKNYLNVHIKSVVNMAQERLEVFKKSVQEHFDDDLKLDSSVVPSLHLLATFENLEDDSQLVQKFSKQNIITHSYSKCFVESPKKHGLILGYSSVIGSQIKRKISKMASIYYSNPD